MADTRLLEREPIAVRDSTLELNLELAEEAAMLLGYARLKQTVAAKNGIQDLSRVLKELDIQPFSRESVERYKAEPPNDGDLTDVPRFFKRHRELARIFPWLIALWTILSAIGVAGGLLISWKLTLPCLLFNVGILAKGYEIDDRLAALFSRWERVPLAEYQEEVPLHVLQRALVIKKRVPDAEFYIEQRCKDPLLLVKCSCEEHYIEVWRELVFELAIAESTS